MLEQACDDSIVLQKVSKDQEERFATAILDGGMIARIHGCEMIVQRKDDFVKDSFFVLYPKRLNISGKSKDLFLNLLENVDNVKISKTDRDGLYLKFGIDTH